jgi:predicted nucleic acid-binding protein
MIFVDTSYLLALVNPRDELHPRAQAWANALNEPLLLTEYVLW